MSTVDTNIHCSFCEPLALLDKANDHTLRLSGHILSLIIFVPVLCISKKYRVSYAFLTAGGVLNIIAISANGFMMPYAIYDPSGSDYIHIFMPITNMHLWFLCDVLPLNLSIGDWLLFIGVCLSFLVSFRPMTKS